MEKKKEHKVVRVPPRKAPVTSLKGMLPKPDKPVTLEEMGKIKASLVKRDLEG